MKNKISPNEIIQLLSLVVADKNYSKLQKFDQIEEIIDGYFTLKGKNDCKLHNLPIQQPRPGQRPPGRQAALPA